MNFFWVLVILTVLAFVFGLIMRRRVADGSSLAQALSWIYLVPFFVLLAVTVLVGLVGLIYSFAGGAS